MTRHVVLGAGPVARAIVESLKKRSIDVDVVTRSGTEIPGARAVTASVLDTDRLVCVVKGAAAVYRCPDLISTPTQVRLLPPSRFHLFE